MNPLDWAVPLLACPLCGGALRAELDDRDPEQGILAHSDGDCDEAYPVIDGVPRLLVGADRAAVAAARGLWFAATADRRALAARWSGPTREDPVVRGFDDEWSRFHLVRSPAIRSVFDLYFDVVPRDLMTEGLVALDAGCGAGRWAVELASRGPNVLAIDRGLSIEVAHRNSRGSSRIACVQADLRVLPILPSSVSWAYSLGVLHHIDRPELALSNVTRSVRPGGVVLLYLYYALEDRGPAFRGLFRVVDGLRRIVSRAPRPFAVPISAAIAVLVYWPLARLSSLLVAADLRDLADTLPLSFYRDRPLWMMLNDSLDRFGTSVELRYTRSAMEQLMRSSGLGNVRFSPLAPRWHALGTVR